MQCSNARLLSSDLRSSRQSEPQQFRIIAHSKSNQLKACSCAWSRTSGSNLGFPTLSLLQAILLQAEASGK